MRFGVLSKITTSSGGLFYHVRAALNKKRWQPFCDFVEDWLLNWPHPPYSRLVLIGPNAGYTLPASFIQKFQQVIVVEPDPVAWAMFEARFQVRSVNVRQDYFGITQKKPDAQELRVLFAAYPQSIFLFCNVLGQLPILLKEAHPKLTPEKIEIYMDDLGRVLHELIKENCIASYHDRFSRSLRKVDEVIDHLTKGLFPKNLKRKEFPWKLTKRIEHQVEFVRTHG